MKIAFVYTGQGAQTAGMGRELYDNFRAVRDIFDEASEAVGRSVADICFKYAQDELNKTANCQPAIFTLSMAGRRLLLDNGIKSEAAAGFSLGECSALCGSGMLDMSSALKLILIRGEAMQKASDAANGAMYAVIGAELDKVRTVCA